MEENVTIARLSLLAGVIMVSVELCQAQPADAMDQIYGNTVAMTDAAGNTINCNYKRDGSYKCDPPETSGTYEIEQGQYCRYQKKPQEAPKSCSNFAGKQVGDKWMARDMASGRDMTYEIRAGVPAEDVSTGIR
jgi:hypothetical protein